MPDSKPRRGPAVAISLIAVAAAAGLSFGGARLAAGYVEGRSAEAVEAALRAGGHGWAEVRADGLELHLSGTAPDDLARLRARAAAETVADPRRIVDDMQLAPRPRAAEPAFRVELLRNGDEVSIVGLVPADLDRRRMTDTLSRAVGAGRITDLVEAADYPVPDGWDESLAFGIRAAGLAPRAKVSIAPGRVEVHAVAASPAEKAALESALARARPAGLRLDMDVTAPRPVITPFTLRLVKDGEGARFDACSADSELARDRILAAGRKAGVRGEAACTLGLGAPTGAWADAAVQAIAAVGAMGAGSVTISDSEVALWAPATVPADVFDEAAGRLESGLPPLFSLRAEHQQQQAAAGGPAEFQAIVAGQGVLLRGRIPDQRMRDALESLAQARFGQVDSALRVDPSLPAGWTLRAIAAIEAMAGLERGTAVVTPELIRVSGVSGSPTASDAAAARLSQRLGAGTRYELSIRYDRWLDPLLALPSGAECVDRLNAAMQESEIGFEPSKSVIAGDAGPTLDRIGAIMQKCADYRIEIGGHTDAQGSEGFNARLSQGRAEAVLAALKGHGVDVRNMTAHGYGESRPLAENDSEAGREANRRIEFTLLSDDPVRQTAPAPAVRVTGVTSDAEAAARLAAPAARVAATGPTGAVVSPLSVPGDQGGGGQGSGSGSGGDPRAVTHPAPVLTAATQPGPQAVTGEIAEAALAALTVPAVEAAFPDNNEAAPEGLPDPGGQGAPGVDGSGPARPDERAADERAAEAATSDQPPAGTREGAAAAPADEPGDAGAPAPADAPPDQSPAAPADGSADGPARRGDATAGTRPAMAADPAPADAATLPALVAADAARAAATLPVRAVLGAAGGFAGAPAGLPFGSATAAPAPAPAPAEVRAATQPVALVAAGTDAPEPPPEPTAAPTAARALSAATQPAALILVPGATDAGRPRPRPARPSP